MELPALRIKKANLLGYETFADYALEVRMAKDRNTVNDFISQLLVPSLPFAKKDVAAVAAYAKKHGFKEELMPWDFSYWSERLQKEQYSLNEELLKPYFQLEDCIDAVFGLATRLYGITFDFLTSGSLFLRQSNHLKLRCAIGKNLANNKP